MKRKKVLIVVDYQKDFVDGSLGFDTAPNLDEGIASLIEQYIESGDYVIVTKDTHGDNYLNTQEGRKLPVKHTIKGTAGHELYGKTNDVVNKYTDSGLITIIEKCAFPSLELGNTLADLNELADIESITLTGVVTHMCVLGNAVEAKGACPEAEIIIKKDLVDSFDKELQQKALDVMESMQMAVE